MKKLSIWTHNSELKEFFFYFYFWTVLGVLSRIWSSHSGRYKDLLLLGCNTLQSVENLPTFRRSMSPPSSGCKNKRSKKPAYIISALIASCFLLVYCLAYSSTMKVESYSSEMSFNFQRTTRRYIPEARTLLALMSINYNILLPLCITDDKVHAITVKYEMTENCTNLC
jgi:hypothetical protein